MKRPPYHLFVFLVSLLPVLAYSQTNAPERVLWDARPIPVHIQRNNERIIHFPNEIRYWLPDVLQNRVSVIAANGVLYIRALGNFPTTRIRVQSLTDNQIFLLDVMANDTPSLDPELIVMTNQTVMNQASSPIPINQSEDWKVRLSRYAAQTLYAPERLLTADSEIRRVPLGVNHAIALIRTGIIEAIPLASWQGGGLTVTAVKLRNLQEHPFILEFTDSERRHAINLSRLVRGNWLTITLQHQTLGALGYDDTTTVYLVSEQAFIESVGVDITSEESQGVDQDG